MGKMNRRKLLASIGAAGGAAVLWEGQRSKRSQFGAMADETAGMSRPLSLPHPAWEYVRLDPSLVAERAYRIYPDGGCMYAVVGSVIGTLADRVGEPFRSFPYHMMRFGDGGVGGWGSLCGVVNGASALIGLFHQEKSKETREELIAEFCTWYEETSLPQYEPHEPQWANEAQPSVANSILCHISTSRWCEESGQKTSSMEKKERCRRLATDGAIKIVEVLNRKAEHPEPAGVALPREAKSCMACHGKKQRGDTMGKMSCRTCHELDTNHP